MYICASKCKCNYDCVDVAVYVCMCIWQYNLHTINCIFVYSTISAFFLHSTIKNVCKYTRIMCQCFCMKGKDSLQQFTQGLFKVPCNRQFSYPKYRSCRSLVCYVLPCKMLTCGSNSSSDRHLKEIKILRQYFFATFPSAFFLLKTLLVYYYVL